MAGVPIPGSYPDSVPPTPDDSMQQYAAPPPEPHGSHRQRNKLHKAVDPRAHKYTDSGVGGMADPDLIQHQSSRVGASNWIEPDDDAGGGTYARDDARHVQPLEPVTSGLDSTSLSQDFENDPRILTASDQAWYSSDPARMSQADSFGHGQPSTEWDQEPSTTGFAQHHSAAVDQYHHGADFTQPTDAGFNQHSSTAFAQRAPAGWSQEASTGFDQQAPVDYNQQPHAGFEQQAPADFNQQPQPPRREASPYWGSLPKGAALGDVHNSVTGHGSATDDHAEHRHLPPKSASSERAVLAGSVADYPRGAGVYNTVVGHGSQDDESRRHNQSHGTEGPDAATGAGILPDIPEGKQMIAGQAPDTAPGFLPETSVRDDVRLAEAASRAAGGSHPQPHSSEASHRSFPLAPSGASTQDDQRASGERGAAADAAGLGAGIAASENADRHRRNSPTGQTSAGAVTGKRRSSRQRSPALEQTSNVGNESPKGEKKHSKILGIFHRHKDEDKAHRRKSSVDRDDSTRLRKQSRGASAERKLLSSAAQPEDAEHPSHNKEKAAAGAAAGAGAFGLLHHHRNKESISEPLSADAGGAGPAGEAPREIEQVSTPFEHPRDAPPPPGTAGEHGDYNVLASGTPSGVQHAAAAAAAASAGKSTTTNEPGHYNTLASGTPSGVSAGAAAHPSRKEAAAAKPADYNVMQSSGPSQDEPRRSGAAVTQGPGNYNTLASGIKRDSATAPGTADYNVLESSGPSQTERGRSGAAGAQEPGSYNTLASGVPSGIKRDLTERKTAAGAATDDAEGENAAEYNVLPSGTPSGVKVKPRSPRRSRHESDPAARGQDESGHGQYSTPASGNAPGAITDDANVTSRPDAMRSYPVPAPTSTSGPSSISATLPQTERQTQQQQPHGPAESSLLAASAIPHHTQRVSQPPNPSQESLPGVTTYPHPEMVHNMSPEVMPDAYTSSARQASPLRAQQGVVQGQQPPEQGMSPEVMPAAYTASSAARQASPLRAHQGVGQQQQQQQQQQQPPREQGMSPEVMPAAYAASAPRASLPRTQHQFQQQQQQPQPQIRDPALAAATTSWATSAGKSSGVGNGTGNGVGHSGGGVGIGSLLGQAPGQGRLVHRCQHCGGENDISGYFSHFGGQGNIGNGNAGGSGLWQRRS